MKGLMKAAFYDPNPVIMLEHKGLYWSKVNGTESARQPEPSRDYIVPIGKGLTILEANPNHIKKGSSLVIISYGMGIHWALEVLDNNSEFSVDLIDLRTLVPLDKELILLKL